MYAIRRIEFNTTNRMILDFRNHFLMEGSSNVIAQRTYETLKKLYPDYTFDEENLLTLESARFYGRDSSNHIRVLAYILEASDADIEESTTYEKGNLLIRIPFPVGTPVLVIKTDGGGQLGKYILDIEEFHLNLLDKYDKGLVFTDLRKANEAVIEMNRPKVRK